MSISAISSSQISYPVVNNSSEISQLEKQKTSLQKDLTKESASKDDEKTKQAKAEELQAEIQQIDIQIQQLQAEKNNQNPCKQTQSVNTNSNTEIKSSKNLNDGSLYKKIDVQA